MVYGLWSMVYGLWSMVYGLWSMVYGLWSMVYGPSSTFFGLWSLVTCQWPDWLGSELLGPPWMMLADEQGLSSARAQAWDGSGGSGTGHRGRPRPAVTVGSLGGCTVSRAGSVPVQGPGAQLESRPLARARARLVAGSSAYVEAALNQGTGRTTDWVPLLLPQDSESDSLRGPGRARALDAEARPQAPPGRAGRMTRDSQADSVRVAGALLSQVGLVACCSGPSDSSWTGVIWRCPGGWAGSKKKQ
jgi:hypothetical protein